MERIQKVLAQHGLGSRREVERWIAEGRIRLNGVVAQAGAHYAEGDRVLLDERDITRRLERAPAAQVIAYHKPQGQAISRQPGKAGARQADAQQLDETAEERLPVLRGARWVAINPMHPGDSGLLLFTNDGQLSFALTRQKKKIPAAYMVRVQVRGAPPVLSTTLRLDQEIIEFSAVTASGGPEGEQEPGGNHWYKVLLPRADKRAAVRALFASHNLSVSRMMQVAFGEIELTRDMPRARPVPLKPKQLAALYALAGLSAPKAAQSTAGAPQDARRVAARRAPRQESPGPRRSTRTRRSS